MGTEDKVINFKELKRDIFFEKVKRKTKETIDKAKDLGGRAIVTAMNHPAQSLAAFTAGCAVAKKGLQVRKVKMEDRRRACDFYDPRCGRHVIARRPLTRKESKRAQKLYDSDKNARWSIILDDMGLLK